MLTYPPYKPGDYNCLSPDLQIVDFALEVERLEQAIATSEKAVTDAKRLHETSFAAVQDAVLDDVARKLLDIDSEARRVAAARALADVKRALKPPRNMANFQTRQRGVNSLIELYARFDAKAFVADVKHYIDQSGEVDYSGQVAKEQGKLGSLTAKLNKHWKGMAKCFLDETLPQQWREFRVVAPVDQAEERQRQFVGIAQTIVRSFLRDWRERAPLFECPVDVNGIAIHTLPAHRRTQWAKAYEQLSLGDLPRRVIFKYRTSADKTVIEPVRSAPALMFSKEGTNGLVE